jgi:hypothetical protein
MSQKYQKFSKTHTCRCHRSHIHVTKVPKV